MSELASGTDYDVQVRAYVPEGLTGWSQTASTNTSARQGEPPTVEGKPSLSEAGADGVWGPGETVEVTLGFSEAVTVDTAGGTPTVGLTLGGTEVRSAAYVRGSGSTELVFGYTLIDADGSHNAMIVPIDSLAFNGGTIRSEATGADAALAHSGGAKVAAPVGPRDDGLTARFENVPAHHDGSTGFTVELRFSEEPAGLSYKTVQGGLLEVSGGAVTGARRLTPGSNRGWAVSIEPTHGADVAIRLPARACAKSNAICVNGEPLARDASATVPGVSLTASFLDVPAEHDGETPFIFELRFSMEMGMSYRTLRDSAFTVTNGSVRNARRLEQGKNRRWEITVEPDGLKDVTVSLPATTDCDASGAICASADRKLSNTTTATVRGPVTLSVADARAEEGTDATIDFRVTLSRAGSTEVTVDYATLGRQ